MGMKTAYLKNSIFNVLGWSWLVILNIITIPYILNKLGYDAYGIFVLVLLVLGYFAFLDLGLGDAIIKYVSHYYALNDYQKLNSTINSILYLFMFIGLIGGILLLVFAKLFALAIFKIPDVLQSQALFCFNLAALGFFLNLILNVFSKIPEALQRFDISNRNNMITGTIVGLSNVLVLFLGYGLKTLVIVNLLGSMFGITIFYISDKRLVPQLVFGLKFNFMAFREISRFGIYTVFTKICGTVTDTANQIFIGAIVGPSGVAIFNIPFRIVSKFHGFLYRISFVLFPVSSELVAKKNTSQMEKAYFRLSRYFFLISTTLFIPIIVYSNYILLFWLGSEFAIKGIYPMIMITLSFYFISQTMVPASFALGLGKPKYNALFSFLTALINMSLIYPLTKKWGINGAATSFLLSSLQAPIAIYIINRKAVGISNKEYFNYVYRRFLAYIIIGVLLFLFVFSRLMQSLPSFLIILLLSFGLLAFILYISGFEPEEKKLISDKIALFGSKRSGSIR